MKPNYDLDYDAGADFANSISFAYSEIRRRMTAEGGKWNEYCPAWAAPRLDAPNVGDGLHIAGWPTGKFRAIAVDPPWHFRARTALQMSNWTSRRDAEKHYPVMGVDDIAALPIKALADPDGCHLFMWTTGPCLPLAFDVMKAWGFRYSSVAFTWVKFKRSHNPNQLRILPTAESDLHVGLGLTTRKNAEFCLLGRRGNAKRVSKKVREIILSPVREHSRKPDEAYCRIMEYCAGPYVELFARSTRPGWTAWGDEVGKFGPVAVHALTALDVEDHEPPKPPKPPAGPERRHDAAASSNRPPLSSGLAGPSNTR